MKAPAFALSKLNQVVTLFAILLLLPSLSLAQDTPPLSGVPEPLQPWIEWVKEKHPEWKCAWDGKKHQCAWPGRATYVISKTSAKITLEVELQKRSAVPLPMNGSLKAQSVRITNEAGEQIDAPFRLESSSLTLDLPPGRYRIESQLLWEKLPSALPLPKNYGMLQIDASQLESAAIPERRNGSIWLQRRESRSATDSLRLRVFRALRDGSPFELETLLSLSVSGSARPLNLGSVLPETAVPIAVTSPLSFQLSPKGELALQLRPGQHQVRILSIVPQAFESITLPKPIIDSWPKEETLSFFSDQSFRTVELGGARAVHAAATELPPEWQSGASYLLEAGGSLNFKELRRGMLTPPPSFLNLRRDLWPDLGGNGMTVRDQFNGTLTQNFRLDASVGTHLGRATLENQPTLITKNPDSDQWGVELRSTHLQLNAISRYEQASEIPAVGWDTTVENLQGSLHLPPSWKLLHIGGASFVSGAWLDSWSLLRIFVSFLVVAASFKLLGTSVAAIIAACMVLNQGEYLAPQMLFLHLLLLIAWRSVLTDEKSVWHLACNVLLYTTFAVLSVECLAFAKLQFTQMLFPQLESGTRYRSLLQDLLLSIETAPLVWPIILFYLGLGLAWVIKMYRLTGLKSRLYSCIKFFLVGLISIPIVSALFALNSGGTLPLQIAKEAMYSSDMALPTPSAARSYKSRVANQAMELEGASAPLKRKEKRLNKSMASGPAVPNWKWHSHHFTVAGPVSADSALSLWILKPTVMRFIAGLRVILILAVVLLILKKIWSDPSGLLPEIQEKLRSSLSTALILLLSYSLFVATPRAQAEIPDATLLKELEQRLEKQRCLERECSSIEKISIKISDESFVLRLETLSEGLSIVSIPGPIDVFNPERAISQGKSYTALRRNKEGFLELKTNGGREVYEILGSIPRTNAFSLKIPQAALAVEVEAPGWQVEGVSRTGVAASTLRFTQKQSGEHQQESKSQEQVVLPTWVEVDRSIRVGQSVAVITRVKRLGDTQNAASVKIPLLGSEQVTSGQVKVVDDAVQLYFEAGKDSLAYSSTLNAASRKWELGAKAGHRISEKWNVSCLSSWQCRVSGLTPTSIVNNNMMQWSWKPFPGEQVSIAALELSTLAGESITVDSLKHNIKWGSSLLQGTVEIQTRVTEQRNLDLRLGEEFAVKDVQVNGQSGLGLSKENTAQVLLTPGSHFVRLNYEAPFSPSTLQNAPELSLNVPAHNISIMLQPTSERWVLWTGGPAWGPCVVYWAKMIIIVGLCLILRRGKLLSVSVLSAILLGIGLATLPIITLWLPLLWLALLSLIPRNEGFFRGLPRLFRSSAFLVLTLLALLFLYEIVRTGLVLSPPMLIVGNLSSAYELKWYLDHSSGAIEQPWVFSLPISFWRGFSLLWSMWLVVMLFTWIGASVKTFRDVLFSEE